MGAGYILYFASLMQIILKGLFSLIYGVFEFKRIFQLCYYIELS